jgi:DNA helicase-2/ATP-dependent DNA helicase PcrA
MPEVAAISPAEAAAQEALDRMFQCIQERKNFRLEAGAGAGKTYSLVKALQRIINDEGAQLIRRHQKVACITYTNVATDEVISRTDGHPAVQASTIHSFCWELCKNFQSTLRDEALNIPKLNEKIEEAGGLEGQRVGYDLGHRRVTQEEILLHHDDVLKLMVALLESPKFRRILTARFPILFIDEYQDSDAALAESLVRNFVEAEQGPLIGLFGDSWQKIYRTGAGAIEHSKLHEIGKEANFRSVPAVVDVLNRIRPNLPQQVSDPAATGTVKVYHSNDFGGQRQTGGQWKGDLPPADGHAYLSALREHLADSGWDFSPLETKILMLTHNVLASELNYKRVLDVFEFNDSIFQKEDAHIAFFADTIEPACAAFIARRFGEMFSVIGRKVGRLNNVEEKQNWARDMQLLVELRQTGTIGEVIDLLKDTRRPRLPDAVLRTERRLAEAEREEIDESRTLRQIEKLRPLHYSEVISLAAFINDHTPFSTKHGVKGAEFENVLVVLGRGWNQYNWNQFLEWFPDRYPADKEGSYERNRNLFYVACSRPRTNLALLFTQELSADALNTLVEWFGAENVSPFNPA